MNIFYKIFRRIRISLYLTYIRIFCKNITIGEVLNYRKCLTLNVAKNAKLVIGNNVFFNNYCSVNCREKITIGKDCIFGEAVRIYDHNHVFKLKDTPIQEQGFSCKDVSIGDNCWIGSNVVILPGTTIGNNVVISAGSIIKGNIPSDVLVRQTYSNQIIEAINYIEKN